MCGAPRTGRCCLFSFSRTSDKLCNCVLRPLSALGESIPSVFGFRQRRSAAWTRRGGWIAFGMDSLHIVHHAGSGPPLIFLHGFAAGSYSWRHWTPLLESREYYLVDLLGHGHAPAPERGDYTPEAQAALVVRFIRERGLRGVCLVGHSMGGGIALLAALTLLESAPGSLGRLVLIAGAALRQTLPPFIRLARGGWLARAAMSVIPKRALIRTVLRSVVHDPRTVTDAQVESYAAPFFSAAHRRAFIETALNLVPDAIDEYTARYPEIDLPTLLLWGEHDHVVPVSVGRKLLDVLPNAQLELIPECGHLPPEELPEASMAVLQSFLADE